MMSEQKVPRSVEQRIVIKFLVGENVPSAEIHHRLQQQYGKECLLRNRTEQVVTRAGGRMEVVASLSQGRTAAAQCGLFTYKSVPVIFEPPCILSSVAPPAAPYFSTLPHKPHNFRKRSSMLNLC